MVTICEGEKCTGLVHQLQWPCVSTALGAKSVSLTDFTPLRHFKQFVILRDNDKAGLSYSREISAAIRRLQPEAEIFVCNLSSDQAGDDVIDWAKKFPLCGIQWDGFTELNAQLRQRVAEALCDEIETSAIHVEECPYVQFRSELALFDGDPEPPQLKARPVSAYPVELLPSPIKEYVMLCSQQMCIPADFQATALIGFFGGLIGRAVQLDMRPGHCWKEAANIWAMLVGRPSARKSPVLRRTFELLAPIEEAAQKDYADAMKVFNTLPKQKGDLKLSEPTRRRVMTDDFTTPKLRELLSENPRGLILRSDELKGQLEKFDRDGSEGDRSFIMQCWTGLGFYDEDRIARGSRLKVPLNLTWIGCIQPACLSYYIRQSIGEGKGADGLLQRFQMISCPDFNQPYQICKEPMPVELEKQLVELATAVESKTRNGNRCLTFSTEAQDYFDCWETSLQQDCRSGEHPAYWESHLGKQPKLLAALCIILHTVDEVLINAGEPTEISLRTLKVAERLVLHYLEHAKRCYSSVENMEVSDARKIMEAIVKKKLSARFKTADIYRNELGDMDRARATNCPNTYIVYS